MDTKKFIFIGGLHRSGTSLIHEIIKNHPRISGFSNTGVPEDEGQHLQTIIPTAKVLGGPGKFGFNKDAYMNELHPLATKENSAKIFAQWSNYWDLSSDFLLEKSPPNLVRTRFLQSLFPNSSFVITLRHPVVVAYATQKWAKKMSISELIKHSIICYETFLNDLSYLNKCFVFRYENFVRNPQEILNKLFICLNIDPILIDKEVRTNVNEIYLKQWSMDKVKTVNSEFINLYEDRTRKLGYSLENPDTLNSTTFLS